MSMETGVAIIILLVIVGKLIGLVRTMTLCVKRPLRETF